MHTARHQILQKLQNRDIKFMKVSNSALPAPRSQISARKLFHLMKAYAAFFAARCPARCQAITFWKMPLPPVSMTSP